jgi:hypothetical protein
MNFNRWTCVELAGANAAATLAFAGDRLSKPLLLYSGIVLFGVTAMIFGLDGILNRRIILPSRYHRHRSDTYLGIAAFGRGVLCILWGSFFVGGLRFLPITTTADRCSCSLFAVPVGRCCSSP